MKSVFNTTPTTMDDIIEKYTSDELDKYYLDIVRHNVRGFSSGASDDTLFNKLNADIRKALANDVSHVISEEIKNETKFIAEMADTIAKLDEKSTKKIKNYIVKLSKLSDECSKDVYKWTFFADLCAHTGIQVDSVKAFVAHCYELIEECKNKINTAIMNGVLNI